MLRPISNIFPICKRSFRNPNSAAHLDLVGKLSTKLRSCPSFFPVLVRHFIFSASTKMSESSPVLSVNPVSDEIQKSSSDSEKLTVQSETQSVNSTGSSSNSNTLASTTRASEVEKKKDSRIPFQTEVHKYARRSRDKKYALLLGYSGTGYNGMQWNPEVPTIEDEVLSALAKLELIPPDWKDNMQALEFQRCARTDKGVSAAGQVISIPLPECNDGVMTKINEQLPSTIRVFGYRKTTRGFNSKTWCSARTYLYTIPTFAFAPFEETVLTYDYRIPPERITQVREFLQRFTGTNNFHNFTVGVKAWQDSAKRHMKGLSCGDPFICDGLELVEIRIKGQSFMMHQIRKMVGLIVCVMRGHVGAEIFDTIFGPQKADIPRAPGLGLMLQEVHFELYNNKFGNDGMHEKLEWPECQEAMEKLKSDHIFPALVRGEKEENSTLIWLSHLHNHIFGTRELSDSDQPPKTHSALGKALYSVEKQREREESEDNAESDVEEDSKPSKKRPKVEII